MKADKNSVYSAVFGRFAPMWLFAALVIIYALSLWAVSISEQAAAICSLLPFAAGFIGCVLLKINGKLKGCHITAVIFLLCIAIRVVYILATPWNERQHDVFVFETQGHAGYIYTLMKTGKLPDTNTGLFYHPPLHPYLMSLVGNLLSKAINTTEQVFETLQLLTAYYSLMCGYVFLKILNFLKMRQGTQVLFFAFFSLHPSLIIFSGSINNDILCLLLSMCTVLYLVRFWQSQDIKNALLMALFLGLAMMTKLSAVTLAPIIAAVFIIRLIKPAEKRTFKNVLVNELCFGALSIPLGMWYPIRNFIKFGQPVGYVMPIGKDHALYCGDRSIFERFISFPVRQLFDNPYCLPEEDYNIPSYIVKCSMFGEYSFEFPKWAVQILLAVNCAVIIYCVFASVWLLMKKNSQSIILTAVSAVSLLFFIWFNIRYPNGCSMDFRYISISLASSAAVGAMYFDCIAGRFSKVKKFFAVLPFVVSAAFTLCLYFSEELFII